MTQTVQDLQAQLLIVKAKAYDDREKAEATEAAYKEAINAIAKSLGFSENEPVTVSRMCELIEQLYASNSQLKAQLNEKERLESVTISEGCIVED